MTDLCIPVSDLFPRFKEDILPLINCIELRTFNEPVSYGLPMSYHSSFNLIHPDFKKKLEEFSPFEFFRRHNINYISFDLGPACTEYEIINKKYVPLSRILDEEEIFKIAGENISWLRNNFSGNISIENLNYYRTGAYETVCTAGFISKFLNRFDLSLLLDIGHVIVSAGNLDLDVEDYIKGLPLDRVTGIHLSHAGTLCSEYYDLHEVPADEDYLILDFIMQRSKPGYIVIEYYKDINYLIGAYRRLKEKYG